MNPLRLVQADPAPTAVPTRDADPVESWLSLLMPMLDGPAREREGVVDELRDHLTQRVRDLMLGGVREAEAVNTAISELGDASAFARQWSSARSAPRRRLIMGIAAGFAVAASLGITAAVMVPPQDGEPNEKKPVVSSAFQPAKRETTKALDDVRFTARAGDTWEQFIREVGERAKMPVAISWTQLQALPSQSSIGTVEPTTQLGVDFAEMKLSSALRLLNEARGLPAGGGVDTRVIDGCLVFSTATAFDKAESVLVTYDLTSVPDIDIGGEASTVEQIKKTIQTLVEPSNWAEGGNDIATLSEVNRKLFIRAPRRMHEQIEWVLREVKNTGNPADGEPQVGALHAVPDRPVADVKPAGFSAVGPAFGAVSAEGVKFRAVPVLGAVPVMNRLFTAEEAAPLVIRATGGVIRITAPDGTSVEAEELRVSPAEK
jgi:hypothetical protein